MTIHTNLTFTIQQVFWGRKIFFKKSSFQRVPERSLRIFLAAAATVVVVVAATAAAAVVTAAAAQDDDEKNHPTTAIVTEETIVTHNILPPLIDYIP